MSDSDSSYDTSQSNDYVSDSNETSKEEEEDYNYEFEEEKNEPKNESNSDEEENESDDETKSESFRYDIDIRKLSLKSIPKWAINLIPKDLLDALNKNIKKPKCRGRTTSINSDNVNDFAYYVYCKKASSYNPFLSDLKGKKGISPQKYSLENKKYKCYTFICIERNYNIESPFTDMNSFPTWYKYLYIIQSLPVTVPTDILYDLMMQSPSPIECIKLFVSRLNQEHYSKKLLCREKINKEKDLKFYQSLSESDKDILLEFIWKKKIVFDIFQAIEKENNFNRIALFLGLPRLCDYVIQKNKYKEFQIFVDRRRKSFQNMHHYEIIIPKYRPLYQYAFSQANFSGRLFKGFYIFINNLFVNNCLNEVSFMISKKWEWKCYTSILAIKTMNPKLISMISPAAMNITMDILLKKQYEEFYTLLRMGYYPSIIAIGNLYKDSILRKDCIHFQNIKYLPPNKPLDSMKSQIAHYHPELIKEFIAKFSHRFNDNTIDSWFLEQSENWNKYLIACKELGINHEMLLEKLFDESISNFMTYSNSPDVRNIILKCLTYPHIIRINRRKYLLFAIDSDDVELAIGFIKCGADTNIPNLKNKCSDKMYRAIWKYL